MNTQEFIYCDEDIVYAGLWGVVAYNSWSHLFCGALALAGIHQTRDLLIDLRETHLPVHTPLFQKLPSALKYMCQSGFYKMAVIVERRASEYSFFETVFLNRGSRLRIFTEYHEAKAWLKPENRNLDLGMRFQNAPVSNLN